MEKIGRKKKAYDGFLFETSERILFKIYINIFICSLSIGVGKSNDMVISLYNLFSAVIFLPKYILFD